MVQLSNTSNSLGAMLYDVAGDFVKEGTYDERTDLLVSVVEQVLKDLKAYQDNQYEIRKLEPLFRLLNTYADEDLLGYLPENNGIYKPEVCGMYRP